LNVGGIQLSIDTGTCKYSSIDRKLDNQDTGYWMLDAGCWKKESLTQPRRLRRVSLFF
jgi:hypothetical protein